MLRNVNNSDNVFSGQEYLYDFSFLLSLGWKNLFNWDAKIITVGELQELAQSDHRSELFLRPNSGNKQFSGRAYLLGELRQPLTYFWHVNPWELIVVADVKRMPLEEYRFFCLRDKNDEIHLVGTRYLPSQSLDVPTEALAYATERANEIFDIMTVGSSFVLDVGLTTTGYKVIELNSWESSSFYCIEPRQLLEMIWNENT